MALTTDPNDPKLKEGQQNKTGQHDIYLVLSDEERAKGFVRPLRHAYTHVGKKVEAEGTLQTLEEGLEGHSDTAKSYYTRENGYAGFLKYPDSKLPLNGKFLTQKEYEAIQLKKEYEGGCGVETKMAPALAETYAREPKFYGATFCCGCNRHLPVEEFVWSGTTQTVGS